MVDIGGYVDPGYEGVRDAFERNFDEHSEIGAGYALYVDGAKVVDLWGGTADRRRGERRTPRTRFSWCSPPPRARRRRAPTCSRSGVSSTSTCRSPTTGRSSRRRARSASRCATCCATSRACPTFDAELGVEGRARMGSGDRGAGRAGALLGPGVDARLPRRHLRLPAGRGGAPHHREVARHVLPRRVRRAARPRVLDRAPGGAGGRGWRRWSAASGVSDGGRAQDEAHRSSAILGPDSLLVRVAVDERVAGRISSTGSTRPRCTRRRCPAANGITNARSLARFYAGLIGTVDGGPAAPLLTPRAGRQGAHPPDRGPRPRALVPGHRRGQHHRPGLLDRVRVRARSAAAGSSGTRVRVGRSGSPTPTTRSPVAT